MNRFSGFIFILLFFFTASVKAQQVIYSESDREDSRDINFEVIGKMNDHILVYKNIRWKHKLSIYDNEMKTQSTVFLDFVPEKTFNIDFVVYPDFFYMIYQYQKKSILHCMAVKMDGNGKKMTEPVELDTTEISMTADNKIYSTIYSEDKQKIMLFKIQKKSEKFHIVTLLYDNHLQLIKKSRDAKPFDERRDNYGDFMLDNEGNFVFTMAKQAGLRENSNLLNLVTKKSSSDTFDYHTIDLSNKYINEVRLKIDNLNKRYIINSFYYPKSRGSVEGLFSCTWDPAGEKQNASVFNILDDYLRAEAKSEGLQKFVFDDFEIRQIITKKDGGYLLTAEDYSSNTRDVNNNSLSRWDNPYNSFSSGNNSYYSYNPYYGYYRPLNSNYYQSTRFYYANIIILSIDKNGNYEWGKVMHKDQFEDDDDSFLSFSTIIKGDEIHFLYNLDSKNQIITDQSVSSDGTVKRNATLKSEERGYEFMTKLSKQVGAKQLIIPCSYRGNICFAKIEF